MKFRHILIVAATVAVMVLYFFKNYQRAYKSAQTDIEESDEVQSAQPPAISDSQSLPTAPAAPAVSGTVQSAQTGVSTTAVTVSEAVAKKFGAHMANLERCFSMPPSVSPTASQNPTQDKLLDMLRNNLGEPILQQDDWTQFDILDGVGVKKRVRVDFEYPDGVTPRRRLSVYTLNNYGSYEIDNLTNDQADNPNESYVESFKDGQRVVHQEKGARMFFSQGEEFVYTDRNGLLDSVTIYKGDKTYSCTYLSDDRSSCNCM